MKKSALIIGNSVFADERLNKLNAPSKDIEDLSAVLRSEKIGAFDDVELVANCSLEPVQLAMSRFLQGRSSDDVILIYYTGHGLLDPRGKLFLALSGSNPEFPEVGSFAVDSIHRALNQCASRRQVVILDCCHSGAYMEGRKSASNQIALTEKSFRPKGLWQVCIGVFIKHGSLVRGK